MIFVRNTDGKKNEKNCKCLPYFKQKNSLFQLQYNCSSLKIGTTTAITAITTIIKKKVKKRAKWVKRVSEIERKREKGTNFTRDL